jgi:hypothetical protein
MKQRDARECRTPGATRNIQGNSLEIHLHNWENNIKVHFEKFVNMAWYINTIIALLDVALHPTFI